MKEAKINRFMKCEDSSPKGEGKEAEGWSEKGVWLK